MVEYRKPDIERIMIPRGRVKLIKVVTIIFLIAVCCASFAFSMPWIIAHGQETPFKNWQMFLLVVLALLTGTFSFSLLVVGAGDVVFWIKFIAAQTCLLKDREVAYYFEEDTYLKTGDWRKIARGAIEYTLEQTERTIREVYQYKLRGDVYSISLNVNFAYFGSVDQLSTYVEKFGVVGNICWTRIHSFMIVSHAEDFLRDLIRLFISSNDWQQLVKQIELAELEKHQDAIDQLTEEFCEQRLRDTGIQYKRAWITTNWTIRDLNSVETS